MLYLIGFLFVVMLIVKATNRKAVGKRVSPGSDTDTTPLSGTGAESDPATTMSTPRLPESTTQTGWAATTRAVTSTGIRATPAIRVELTVMPTARAWIERGSGPDGDTKTNTYALNAG